MSEYVELFWDSFCYAGTSVITCDCGRTHFATYDGEMGFEEGELKDLREKSNKEPDKYMETSDQSSISWIDFCGKNIIYNCPCKEDVKICDMIYSNRHPIMSFLGKVIAEKREVLETEVAAEEKLLQGASE